MHEPILSPGPLPQKDQDWHTGSPFCAQLVSKLPAQPAHVAAQTVFSELAQAVSSALMVDLIFPSHQCSVITKTLGVLKTQTLREACLSRKLLNCRRRQSEMVLVGRSVLWISNWGIGECVLNMLGFHFDLPHRSYYYIALKKSPLSIFFWPGSPPNQHLPNPPKNKRWVCCITWIAKGNAGEARRLDL